VLLLPSWQPSSAAPPPLLLPLLLLLRIQRLSQQPCRHLLQACGVVCVTVVGWRALVAGCE
jgi:hypothetical protein